MSSSSKFLLDANSFMNAYHTYYSFELAPSFWVWIKTKLLSHDLILMKIVADEVIKGNDELADWMKQLDKNLMLDHRTDSKILKTYAEVLQYVRDCGFYKELAFREWAKADVADAWLIAAAMVYGYKIVSFEERNNQLQKDRPSKSAKIPNVCDHFGIKCVPLYQAVSDLHFRFK